MNNLLEFEIFVFSKHAQNSLLSLVLFDFIFLIDKLIFFEEISQYLIYLYHISVCARAGKSIFSIIFNIVRLMRICLNAFLFNHFLVEIDFFLDLFKNLQLLLVEDILGVDHSFQHFLPHDGHLLISLRLFEAFLHSFTIILKLLVVKIYKR